MRSASAPNRSPASPPSSALAVVALSALYVARLAGRRCSHESQARGAAARQRDLPPRASKWSRGSADPYAALRSDPGLRVDPRVQHLRRERHRRGDPRRRRASSSPTATRRKWGSGSPERAGPGGAGAAGRAVDQLQRDLLGGRADARSAAADACSATRRSASIRDRRVDAADAAGADGARCGPRCSPRRRRWRRGVRRRGCSRSCCCGRFTSSAAG